jgi:hypothetical protein
MAPRDASAVQAILDELLLSRRRMLAGDQQDTDLLEANRQAIAYWSKRVRGGRADRSPRATSPSR